MKYKAHVTILHGPNSGKSAHHSNAVIDTYNEWLEENEIINYEYRIKFNDHGKDYDIHSFYCIYWFINEHEAMAFKLRWS